MSCVTVVPAYGRDYTSADEVRADFLAGKDFIIRDMSSPYDGRYLNLEDFNFSDYQQVRVRYNCLDDSVFISK